MGMDMRGRVHGPCVLISHRSSFLHARMEIQTEPNSTSAAEILLTYTVGKGRLTLPRQTAWKACHLA